MKRLPTVLLIVSALLLLGGCALQPAYRYNANAGGGYYAGQSPYGNADTVIYSSSYGSPWGGGWGPGWGYGPRWGYGPTGWWGTGGIGIGATYVYRPHHRDYRRDRRHHRWHRSGRHERHHSARPQRPQQHARPSRSGAAAAQLKHPVIPSRSTDKPDTNNR
ncbi:MAG TPA: hypothetical protein VFJ15_02955 [Oleiagrimonas sp.]|nr:hypothetical protein [Oleiagrimonas sp.]